MDIAAHALWAGAGITVLGRHRPIAPATAAATVLLAALPDIVHMLPLLAWWAVGDGTLAAVRAYAVALPGQEPAMPPWVALASHHLHCVMHSLFAVGGATLLVWAVRRTLWIPLLGWWSHIVIDVFTHSATFYPVPVLYPLTDRGFDGVAWNTPWFMVLNYTALAAVGVWLLLTRARTPRR